VRTRHGGNHKILEEMETSKGSPATSVEEETKAVRELAAAKKMEKKGWAASYSRGGRGKLKAGTGAGTNGAARREQVASGDGTLHGAQQRTEEVGRLMSGPAAIKKIQCEFQI
jgi:hypothetical protein